MLELQKRQTEFADARERDVALNIDSDPDLQGSGI